MFWIETHAHAAEYERDNLVRNATRDAAIRQELEAAGLSAKAPAPTRQPSFIRRLVLGQ
ncbi:MAG: hypothetical protein IT302_14035 [Dehalococcoidia bacterium]|nr:hypothetical protein [Dehalococcoidia bacterium]